MATGTVFSSPERRRRWASSERARIVEERLQPGAVVTVVPRRHDVHPNLLHNWRRQAKRAAGGGGLQFLPVAVTPSVQPAAGSFEIELAGNVRVRGDGSVDEAALGR